MNKGKAAVSVFGILFTGIALPVYSMSLHQAQNGRTLLGKK